MKKIMKVKKLLIAMVFSVAVLGGYQAYEKVSLTSVEPFLLENVEALTSTESDFWFNDTHWTGDSDAGGSSWFPFLLKCTAQGVKGKEVLCSSGSGNCWNGTACIRDTTL